MEVQELAKISNNILDAVGKVIVGKRLVLRRVFAAILAQGHILMEDYPGLAKTLLANCFAQVLTIGFARIQFTPDLLPGDITGSTIYNQQKSNFEFARGPIFNHLLLADEVNRATPKTQSALLEAMQEHQVTVEGVAHPLEPPFLVFATQNPIEFEGTYPLPEAQLDRFIQRVAVGYPTEDEEVEILDRRQGRKTDDISLTSVVDRNELLSMQSCIEEVHVDREAIRYIVRIVQETRKDHRVQVGASPRGALALFKLARAEAAIDGRDFVTPEDVKAVALGALAHRLILKPEYWARGESEEDVTREVLDRVPTPETLEK